MTATTSAQFAREISSLDGVFGFVDEFVDTHGVGERSAFCLRLVVEELFTNLVKYNREGGDRIDIRLSRDRDDLRLELVDVDVDPFDPTDVAPAPVTAGIDERRPGGLGLHLVRSLVDTLRYAYDPQHRCLRIEVFKHLE